MRRHFPLSLLLSFFLVVGAIGQDTSSAAPAPTPATSSSSTAQQPSIAELLVQGLRAYRTGKFDAAIEEYRAALQQDPKSGEAYAGLARVYLKQEKVQTAFETASKGVTEVPDAPSTHTALGEVYFRQGKMVESEGEFRKGVNTTHPEARAYLGLSRLYDALSLHARARKMLEKAHGLDAEDPDIQRHWIATLSRSERIHALEEYLSKATNEEKETRENTLRYVDLLKLREKEPGKTCKLVTKPASMETDLTPIMYDPTHIEGYGLNLKINGQSSRLLLDTGASGLLISKKMAEKAGIKPLAPIKIGGIGDKGQSEGYTGYADSIKIGALEFQNCLVDIWEKRTLVGDDGLIGADVFSHYLVTLDFPHEKLKLTELPKPPEEAEKTAGLKTNDDQEDDDAATPPEPHDRYIAPEMKSYTTVWRFGHFLLVPTTVGDVTSKLFLIDTGAPMSSISPEAAKEVRKIQESNAVVHGLSGSVKQVYETQDIALEFAHLRKENPGMTVFEILKSNSHPAVEISGILGVTALGFTAMKIDYRDGLVDFDYDKSHWRGISLSDFSKGSK